MSVRIEELEISNPSIRIARNRDDAQRFTVEGTEGPYLGDPGEDVRQQVQREIAALDCTETRTCPSVTGAIPVVLFEFLNKEYWSLPIVVGLLLGAGIGGLFRNPRWIAGVLVAVYSL